MNNMEPAFPVQDCSKYQAHGMTLRDYFAAKAMQGLLACPSASCEGVPPETFAKSAYIYADTMLAQRNKSVQ